MKVFYPMRKSTEYTQTEEVEHLSQSTGRGDLLKCYGMILNSLVRFDDCKQHHRKAEQT